MSPATNRRYPLTMVCETWRVARSSVYALRARLGGPPEPDRRQPAKRGPKTALSDEELLQEIRTVLKASPFLSEGHRKVKARLAARGIRVGKRAGAGSSRPSTTASRTSSAGTWRRRATAGRRWSRSARACGPTWAASARRSPCGLGLRHDWGPQYRARQFQAEIKWLGIRSTPTYVGEPGCNGVAERFIRTLKEECIHLHDFETLEEARAVIAAFIDHYNNGRLLQRHGYMTPAWAREKLSRRAA